MTNQVQCPNCGQRVAAPVVMQEEVASAKASPPGIMVVDQGDNPFASPAADLTMPDEARNPAVAMAGVSNALRGTAPWVTFLAVVGFLFTAMMGALSIGTAISLSRIGASTAALAFFLYGFATLIFGVLSALLWSYGSRIRAFLRSGQTAHMESALRAQKVFWQLVAILAVLYVLALFTVPIITFAMMRSVPD